MRGTIRWCGMIGRVHVSAATSDGIAIYELLVPLLCAQLWSARVGSLAYTATVNRIAFSAHMARLSKRELMLSKAKRNRPTCDCTI